MNGKTKDGFTFTINEKGLDDFLFVMEGRKLIKELKDGASENPMDDFEKFLKLYGHFITEDELCRLAAQITEKEGHAPVERVIEVVNEIMGIAKGKN